MSVFFKVIFSNNTNGEISCVWKVREHALAKQWLEILKSFDSTRGYNSDFDWIMAGNTPGHLETIVNKMRSISEKLVREKGMAIPLELYNNLTRDALNTLHLKFHELAENISGSDNDLDWLNRIVHRAEMCISNVENNSTRAAVTLQLNAYQRIPLDDKDRVLFDAKTIVPGTLIAGYSTIGKNLFSAYWDRDMTLLETKMVRPKIDMSSEVVITMSNYNISIKDEGYFKWCDENKILEKYGYDCRAPEHTPYSLVLADPIEFDNNKLNDFLIAADLGEAAFVKHWEVYTV